MSKPPQAEIDWAIIEKIHEATNLSEADLRGSYTITGTLTKGLSSPGIYAGVYALFR